MLNRAAFILLIVLSCLAGFFFNENACHKVRESRDTVYVPREIPPLPPETVKIDRTRYLPAPVVNIDSLIAVHGGGKETVEYFIRPFTGSAETPHYIVTATAYPLSRLIIPIVVEKPRLDTVPLITITKTEEEPWYLMKEVYIAGAAMYLIGRYAQ